MKEGLHDLYEKAKREQWNAALQLAWDTPVDRKARYSADIQPARTGPYKKLSEKQVRGFATPRCRCSSRSSCTASRGALIVASQLAAGVPWIGAKYAVAPVRDEARNVGVVAGYLRDKLEW